MPDSAILDDAIEILGGGPASKDPRCEGAVFRLGKDHSFGAPQPTVDYVRQFILDGSRPTGHRSENRVVRLPMVIMAPDRDTLAGAKEVLLQTVDQDEFKLRLTRDPADGVAGSVALPMIIDCYRAGPADVVYSVVKEANNEAEIVVSFEASPYGHSDTPVMLAVSNPIPGDTTPAAAVTVDDYSTVSGSGWSRSTQHIGGTYSGMWTPSGSGVAGTDAQYTKTFAAKDLSALPVLTMWVGLGSDYYNTWHKGRVTFNFTLTDGTHTIKFSAARTMAASGNGNAPKWTRLSVPIPQGRPSFNYAAVTGYTVEVYNRAGTGTAPGMIVGPSLRYARLYLNNLKANPQTLSAAQTRGVIYDVLDVRGAARTPVAFQAQQPGKLVQKVITDPGPFNVTFPPGTTPPTADVTMTAGAGAGGSVTGAGYMGGGEGGETARNTALGITPGQTYGGFIGAGGTPQTAISTLAILTTGLPTATVGVAYSFQMAASGGTAPYTWAVTAGTPPTGITLSSGGLWSGTIASGAGGAPSLTIRATDAAGTQISVVLTLRWVTATTLAITTTSVADGSVGAGFAQQIDATGGTAPYTYFLLSGTLPDGEVLSSSGLLSGQPTTPVTNQPFTVRVTDSATPPHTDDQALTQTIRSSAVSSKVLFGVNTGSNYRNGSTYASMWDACYSVLMAGHAGQAFGERSYRPGIGDFPTVWDSGHKIFSRATFAVLSWKVNIGWVPGDSNPLGPQHPSVLGGDYDSKITQFGISCQKKWNANPGSLFVSFWHEGDSLQPGSSGNPTSAQVLHLHAYIFPRFVAACNSVGTPNGRVPYGQMFIGLTVKNNPRSWVSCKATVSGGSDLDYYGLDIYSHGGDPTADTMWTKSADNILSLAPHSRVAVTEANSYNADAIKYFNELFALAKSYNALFYLPFFNGANNGDTICFSTTDSTRPGENAALKTILGQCAPATSVPLGQDPPAVDGGDSSFTGDADVAVVAHGGRSATTSAGASGLATGSTAPVHHDGGAGGSGGAGSGSAPGTPYAPTAIWQVAAGGTLSPQIPVTHAVAAGDAILAITSSNSGVVNSMGDTKGNIYNNVGSLLLGALHLDFWLSTQGSGGGSTPTAALAVTTDKLLPVWASGGAAQGLVSTAVSGIAPGTPVEIVKSNTGTSNAPSTGATAQLGQAAEWAVAAIESSSTGGTPTSWTGGFSAGVIGTAHVGSTQYLTAAQQVTASNSPLTAGATITSTSWEALMIVIPFAGTGGASHGGGGGAAGGQTANGQAGNGSAPGIGVDIAGDGGAGSQSPDSEPMPGMPPGGASGGAASSGPALEAKPGGNGQALINYTVPVTPFSQLLIHTPGPDSPDGFSPLITLNPTDVPNGQIEYPVPSLVDGTPADFDGTYSILAIAGHYDSPGEPRNVQVEVNQYEYPGGPAWTNSTNATFVPSDDVVNGLTEIGTLTLPNKYIDDANTLVGYTISITSTNLLDRFLDVILIDTQGNTCVVNISRADAYLNYWIDTPAAALDSVAILGSMAGREQAVSVLDASPFVTGGPPVLWPGGRNKVLAYSLDGPPSLQLYYFPAYYLGRVDW